jgi:probable phosphoglycerate mutase
VTARVLLLRSQPDRIKEKVSIDIEIKTARLDPTETGVAVQLPDSLSPQPDEAVPTQPKPKPARLLLIRHGQSTWNRERRIQGQLDPPLSEEGREQARRLGHRLAGRRFAGFYSSDLKRAFETADAIAAATGAQPKSDPALREIYLGEWEGLDIEEIAARYPDAWASWVKEPDWDLVPGGERAVNFEARVAGAIDKIFQHHEHGDVLVVTHGGVIQIALQRIVGNRSQGIFPFKIQNTSVSVLEKRNGRVMIAGVNDITHLEAVVITEGQGLGDD